MGAKASGTETIADINMVPLIDIILVVLIIFMVTAPAMIKPSVKVTLPEASSSDETTPSLLNIAISAEGQVMINNEEVDEDGAKELARVEVERNPDVQAVIIADTGIPYGDVIRVLDWVKSQGVKEFAVTTDRPVNK